MTVYAFLQNGNITIAIDTYSIPQGVEYQELEIPNLEYIEYIKYNETAQQFYLLSEQEIQALRNEELAKQKKQEIFNKIKEIEQQVLGKYTQAEINSWPYKIQEALKIINNNYTNDDIPIILNELRTELVGDPTSQELLDRANIILQKKSGYEILSGKIAGVRRKIEQMSNEQILNFNISEIDEIVYGN